MTKNVSNKSNIKAKVAMGAAAVVLTGGLGFQTYQVHQLGEDLAKVEKSYMQSVHDLKNITAKYDNLLLDKESADVRIAELEESVTGLNEKNQSLQEQVDSQAATIKSKDGKISSLQSELSKAKSEAANAKAASSNGSSPRSRSVENSSTASVQTSNSAAKATYVMNASAYSTYENGDKLAGSQWGNLTASGTTVKQGRTIAVDRNLIPLGTKVRLTFPAGWEQYNGVYIAEDTGSAIKGQKIDIYFDSLEVCKQFGRRQVTLEVL